MWNETRRTGRMNRAAALVLAAALAAAFSPLAARAGQPPRNAKIERQIGVMEKIIDKLLIDSPNFVVRGMDGASTRGLYLDEVGALFTFEASPATGTEFAFDMSRYFDTLGDRFETKTDEDGNQVFIIKKNKSKEAKNEAEEHAGRGDAEHREDPRAAMEKNKAQSLEKGRDELVQALLDYGETLTALEDGQSVVIAAFLSSNDFLAKDGSTRIVLRAKMGDIRAYSDGRISEQEMRSRILIQED